MKRTGLVASLALTAALAVPAAASAANPSILNTNTGCSGQTSWLVSCATSGETENNGHILRISSWVQHDLTSSLASYVTDDDWDGTTDPSTVRSITAVDERPTIAGGYPRTRANLSYTIPTSNTGMSCGFLSGTRRTTNRAARIQARDNVPQTSSPATSSQIKFVAAGQCTGVEDFAYLYSWGANNFVNATTLNPGESKTFTYTGDDKDTTGDSDFNGVNWRIRNIRTGATSGATVDCDNNGDNAQKSTTVNFPDRGAFVVEAELLDGGGCGQNQNGGFWFPLGTADVNGATAPSLTLDSATTTQSGVVRPQWQQDWTVRAQGLVDPDSGDGGGTQIVEWDLNNNTGDGVDGYEANNTAGFGSTLSAPQSQNVDSSPQGPGLYSVRARATDNGAGDAADNVRKRTGDVTLQYRVDAQPLANAQTVTGDTNMNSSVTLTGSDSDGDPLTFSANDPPNGSISGGTGASRTYTPDTGFAGDDTFTFTTNDGFGRTSAPATVTAKVRPNTGVATQPPTFTNDNDPTLTFNTNATAVPIAFECKLDSAPTFTACNGASSHTYTNLADGAHTVQVRATASGGNIDPSPASASFTVDTLAPTANVDNGPPNPSNDTTPELDFSNTEAPVTSPVSFQCQLDGGGFAPCATPYETATLVDDVHTFEVKATDQAGNAGPADSFVWRSDTLPPETGIDAAPQDPTSNTTAEFEVSSSELGDFECRLDSNLEADFDPCDETPEFSGLSAGDHTFEVRSTDMATNTDPSPAEYTWAVDLGQPLTSIDSAPPNPSPITDATFESHRTSSARSSAGSTPTRRPTSRPAPPEDVHRARRGRAHLRRALGRHRQQPTRTRPPTRGTSTLTGPETGIIQTPPNPSPERDASFEFSSNELGGFECRLDSSNPGDWASCGSPADYSGLSESEHTFEVRAIDQLGHVDLTPAAYTWLVDLSLGPMASGGDPGAAAATLLAPDQAGPDGSNAASKKSKRKKRRKKKPRPY